MIEAALAAGISTATTTVVGFVFWLAIRRPVDRDEKRLQNLESDVVTLRDEKVKRLEVEVEHNKDQRAKLYGFVAEIRETFVHKKECNEMRRAEAARLADYQAAVLKLERVGERVDQASKRVESVAEELIHTQTDVAALAATVRAMNGKK